MDIQVVRADGVMISVVPEGNTKDNPRQVFLSWKDVDRLTLEHKGYSVVRETVKNLNRKPKA